MARKNHVSETPATQWLRAQGVRALSLSASADARARCQPSFPGRLHLGGEG